jgi:hypothetical protein
MGVGLPVRRIVSRDCASGLRHHRMQCYRWFPQQRSDRARAARPEGQPDSLASRLLLPRPLAGPRLRHPAATAIATLHVPRMRQL